MKGYHIYRVQCKSKKKKTTDSIQTLFHPKPNATSKGYSLYFQKINQKESKRKGCSSFCLSNYK